LFSRVLGCFDINKAPQSLTITSGWADSADFTIGSNRFGTRNLETKFKDFQNGYVTPVGRWQTGSKSAKAFDKAL